MSNIPSSAISNALTPVQRANAEAARALKLQTQKNVHHAEDVEEIDDTAVSSVGEESQSKGEKEKQRKKRANGEVVEIAALDEGAVAPVVSSVKDISRLDISA